MTAKTHIRIGVTATTAVFVMADMNLFEFPFHDNLAAFFYAIVGASFGSIVMDNDTRGSLISNFMPISNRIISWLAKKGVKSCFHRHLFHSLLFLPVLAGCLLYMFWDIPIFAMFSGGCLLGLISHALSDAYLSNTWLLYPICKKPFSVLKLKQEDNPSKYKRIERNTRKLFSFCLIVLAGIYLYHNYLI